MNEEEIYEMILNEDVEKYPLLNEIFAIRDNKHKVNNYTICVNGYISLDVINKAIKLQKENELAKQALIKNCNIADERNQLLKENEKLKNKLLDTLEGQKVIKEETPQYIKENYISKQKVKDKIEELKKEGNYRTIDNPYGRVHFMAEGCDYKIQVLQELIEEREEK